jgi:hypothetical protein
MLKRFLAAVLFAIAALTAAPPAYAQPAAVAQSEDADRAFLVWMQPVLTVLERASVVNEAFQADLNPYARNDQMMRLAFATRDRARGFSQLLSQLQGELRAMPRFEHPGAEEAYVLMAETIVRDTGTYLQNMDAMLGHIISLVDAMEADDDGAIQRIGPRLMQSAVLLLEGQLVTLRARQQLLHTDDTAYHALGAMMSIYESMRVAIALTHPDRAGAMIDASHAAARWSVSGRAATALARADLPTVVSRERALTEQMLVLEERFFVVNDRVVAALEAAARNAENRAAQQRLMELLVQAEADFMRINYSIIELTSELAGAGVEL